MEWRKGYKMKRCIVSLCIILSLCLCLSSTSLNAVSSNLSTTKPNESEQFLINQDAANEAYNRMLSSFSKLGETNQIDEYFPDYYAGAYIGQNGHLVVLTTNASESDIRFLQKTCNNSNITFEVADYSYNQLIALMNDFKELDRDLTFSLRDSEFWKSRTRCGTTDRRFCASLLITI